MAGKFKVKCITNLDDATLETELPESDFATVTPGGKMVQMEYIETSEEMKKQIAKPGIFSIQKTMAGLNLVHTELSNDKILEKFVKTEEITNKVDCFFRNLHKYKEFGIEVPRRGMLLYGPAGTGKSTALNKVANSYAADGKTLVVVWDTVKFEAYEIKDLFKSFEYEGVEKIILICEDIGGVEVENRAIGSDSGLLSLLDNQEKIFKLPIMTIATTNFPENFMGNLTNRSGRFDDKIKVGNPDPEFRIELLKFFSKDTAPQEALNLIGSKDCENFPPAHIKEVVIRSAIHERSMVDVINDIRREIKSYEKGFKDNKRSGMGFHDDDF